MRISCYATHVKSHYTPPRARSRSLQRALTLIEVMVAMFVLVLVMGSILGGFIFTRRATEASIAQNVANHFIHGYLEQIRGLEWDGNFVTLSPPASTPAYTAGTAGYLLNTVTSTGSVDALTVSPLPVPNLGTLTIADTPTGAVDNIRNPIINANTNVTMPMTIWVWVDDQSAVVSPTPQLKRVTIVYKWTDGFGAAAKTHLGSMQTMVSVIRTLP